MPKMISVPKETIEEMIREFAEKLHSAKSFEGGKFTYSKEFKCEAASKAKLVFTPNAYVKMITLVKEFDTEVAWYGVVDRNGDSEFKISDILVYPQKVTGATVDTDEDAHREWLEKIPDEIYNRIRFQGHSHVNMSTSPSTTDLTDQSTRISSLPSDSFFVFIIWNKKNEHTAKIYDLANNILYENSDIDVSISFDEGEFLATAKEQVKKHTYSSGYGYYGNKQYGYGGYTPYSTSYWDDYDYAGRWKGSKSNKEFEQTAIVDKGTVQASGAVKEFPKDDKKK